MIYATLLNYLVQEQYECSAGIIGMQEFSAGK